MEKIKDFTKVVVCIGLLILFVAWKIGAFEHKQTYVPRSNANVQQYNTQQKNSQLEQNKSDVYNQVEEGKDKRDAMNDISDNLNKSRDAQIKSERDADENRKNREADRKKELESKKTQDTIYGR